MRAKATVSLRFADAPTANAVAAATSVDNPRSHARQSVSGGVLTFVAEGPTLPSLRETLDDWLRCAATAAEAAKRSK